jgi:hypothetical protein
LKQPLKGFPQSNGFAQVHDGHQEEGRKNDWRNQDRITRFQSEFTEPGLDVFERTVEVLLAFLNLLFLKAQLIFGGLHRNHFLRHFAADLLELVFGPKSVRVLYHALVKRRILVEISPESGIGRHLAFELARQVPHPLLKIAYPLVKLFKVEFLKRSGHLPLEDVTALRETGHHVLPYTARHPGFQSRG